jgi:indolepyruvate ferredoxin oxidoreductase beta subunit
MILKMETVSVMIVGVGGQGTLLASRILGNVILKEGCDVKVSEVHGMSQRGGSVVTYVKYGDKVFSPVIEKGEADIIVAFELLEAARWVSYLKNGGTLITSTQTLDPMPVITGAAEYPAGIAEKIASAGINVIAADALSLAKEAGSPKAVNVVLMGKLAKTAGFDIKNWEEALEASVPEKHLELNKKAFRLGLG